MTQIIVGGILSVGLAILVGYILRHIEICILAARGYRAAYDVHPEHRDWPEWYHKATYKRLTHFSKGIIRPHETLERFGTSKHGNLVTLHFYVHGMSFEVTNDPNKKKSKRS